MLRPTPATFRISPAIRTTRVTSPDADPDPDTDPDTHADTTAGDAGPFLLIRHFHDHLQHRE
jgi:hypothetical protein